MEIAINRDGCRHLRQNTHRVFVGHLAVGLAAKRAAPRVSIAALIFAAVLADVLWIALFAAGIEKVAIEPGITVANSLNLVYIPFSHSLLANAVWGGLLGGVYWLLRRDPAGAWILVALVVSHWVLDVITHRPDMQLAPGVDARFGLALWNSRLATFVVEGALWGAALVVYARTTRARRRAGVYGFWIVVAVLSVLWVSSLSGDPPPSLRALAIVNTIFLTVLLMWAEWIERSRPATISRAPTER